MSIIDRAQLEELALDREQIIALAEQVRKSNDTFGNFSVAFYSDVRSRVIAELAKQSEPVGFVKQSSIDKLSDPRLAGVGAMLNKEAKDGMVAIYTHPLHHPDLVAEIERLKALSVTNIMIDVVPDVLFDGPAVYQQIDNDKKGRNRTSPENVMDVLDAVVKLIRAASPEGST